MCQKTSSADEVFWHISAFLLKPLTNLAYRCKMHIDTKTFDQYEAHTYA